MTLRNVFLALAAMIYFNGWAAVHTNSLDKNNPVHVERYAGSSMYYISYKGEEIYLNENCIYLDSELPDNIVASFPFIYNNVREAFNTINERQNSAEQKTLYIAPGVYWVDDPDDPEVRATEKQRTPYGMTVSCKSLKIIGLNDNPNNIVLACNRGNMQGAINNFTMFNMLIEDIEVHNITFGNYCNVDLVFPLKAEYNRQKRNEAITQAQLVHTNAEKVFAQNCRFISRLNLCPFTGGHRTLFDNCYMECTDDALSGSAIYHKCRFTFYSSKPLYNAEAYGAVFLDCDIDTYVKDVQYFCKANGGIVAIDTRFHAIHPEMKGILFNYRPKVDSWYFSNVTVNGENQDYLEEYGMDITNLSILKAYKLDIDGETVYNVANLVAGDDEWDPLGQREIIPEEYWYIPTYMQVQNMGEGIMLSPYDDGSELVFNFFRWGGYKATHEEIIKVASTDINWTLPKFIKVATCKPRKSVEIMTQYDLPTRFSGNIAATVFSGLYATNYISIAPYLFEAPRFIEKPSISLNIPRRTLDMNYKLSKDDSGASDPIDRTIVTWYRYTQPNLSDTVPMLWGHVNEAIKTYPLTPGDVGYNILVEVNPRYSDTFCGMPAQRTYTTPFDKAQLPHLFADEKHYETDFHNIPVRYQPRHLKSAWSFDAYKPLDTKAHSWKYDVENAWYFGKGEAGAANSVGLVHNSRGARCFYIPSREKSKEMKALLQIDPAKTAGQGFGSATSQYLDICIKFDPESLTGYALRIERIPDYSDACSFHLVEYINGETKAISDRVISDCFNSTCTITVEQKGKTLTATASSNSTHVSKSTQNVLHSVSLKASVAKNPYSAFCLQHTGTPGSSAALIRFVELDWK